ncbi:MAG: GNAT family N-acetyltransferase [Holdemanella sp.]|nr:GNAT family N-acetyltransferase [Holdemanella sp.]
MYYKKITSSLSNYEEIKTLYIQSFPENERQPFDTLFTSKKIEGYAFYEKETFYGLAIIACANQIAHIIYLCVKEEARNKGYGQMILKHITKIKEGYPIIVDIEEVYDDNEIKKKRKCFYLKNGYYETSIRYTWQKERYEILSTEKDFTREDFIKFWDALGFIV